MPQWLQPSNAVQPCTSSELGEFSNVYKNLVAPLQRLRSFDLRAWRQQSKLRLQLAKRSGRAQMLLSTALAASVSGNIAFVHATNLPSTAVANVDGHTHNTQAIRTYGKAHIHTGHFRFGEHLWSMPPQPQSSLAKSHRSENFDDLDMSRLPITIVVSHHTDALWSTHTGHTDLHWGGNRWLQHCSWSVLSASYSTCRLAMQTRCWSRCSEHPRNASIVPRLPVWGIAEGLRRGGGGATVAAAAAVVGAEPVLLQGDTFTQRTVRSAAGFSAVRRTWLPR